MINDPSILDVCSTSALHSADVYTLLSLKTSCLIGLIVYSYFGKIVDRPTDILVTELSTVLYDIPVLIWTSTCKALSDSPVEDKTTVSVVRVTISESLIDSEQVQVNSIMQVEL